MIVFFAILLFSLLIFVHELGHFLTAKAFKVRVNEFSMFMGPAIFKKQIGECESVVAKYAYCDDTHIVGIYSTDGTLHSLVQLN